MIYGTVGLEWREVAWTLGAFLEDWWGGKEWRKGKKMSRQVRKIEENRLLNFLALLGWVAMLVLVVGSRLDLLEVQSSNWSSTILTESNPPETLTTLPTSVSICSSFFCSSTFSYLISCILLLASEEEFAFFLLLLVQAMEPSNAALPPWPKPKRWILEAFHPIPPWEEDLVRWSISFVKEFRKEVGSGFGIAVHSSNKRKERERERLDVSQSLRYDEDIFLDQNMNSRSAITVKLSHQQVASGNIGTLFWPPRTKMEVWGRLLWIDLAKLIKLFSLSPRPWNRMSRFESIPEGWGRYLWLKSKREDEVVELDLLGQGSGLDFGSFEIGWACMIEINPYKRIMIRKEKRIL